MLGLRRLDKPTYRATYPLTFLKQMGMGEDKANHNAGVLAKLLISEVAFNGKVNKVLDNLNYPLFRWFNRQSSSENTLLSHCQPTLKCCGRLVYCLLHTNSPI